MSAPLDPSPSAAEASAPQSSSAADTVPPGRRLASPFGRGWVPLGRDLGLPGEGLALLGGCPSTIADLVRDGPPPLAGEELGGAPPVAPLRVSAASHEPYELPADALSAEASNSAPSASSASLREPCSRPDLFTPERQARFLAALSETGAVRAACARVHISPECVYRLRRRSAVFAAAWDGALVLARRVAEDVLAQRALEGVEEPVFFRGEQVGARVRFDARLLLAHLARLDAHAAASTYGARRAERFDELLALVAGEVPPEGLAAEPGTVRCDPVLPPDCEAHVEAAIRRLPLRASLATHRARSEAARAEWQGWVRSAQAVADRLAPGGTAARRTLSTVSTSGGLSGSAPTAPGRTGRPTAAR